MERENRFGNAGRGLGGRDCPNRHDATLTRRSLLAALAATLIAPDPGELLWKPGAKLISIAKPPFLALGDLVTFGPYPGVYRVVAEARSMARISDARFKYQSEFPTWAARYRYLVDASDPALEWAFSLQQY